MECKCGCGQSVPKGKKSFVSRVHQLEWMASGGAAQMGALQPPEAREEGERSAGVIARDSGRLEEMARKGRETSERIYREWRASRERTD